MRERALIPAPRTTTICLLLDSELCNNSFSSVANLGEGLKACLSAFFA